MTYIVLYGLYTQNCRPTSKIWTVNMGMVCIHFNQRDPTEREESWTFKLHSMVEVQLNIFNSCMRGDKQNPTTNISSRCMLHILFYHRDLRQGCRHNCVISPATWDLPNCSPPSSIIIPKFTSTTFTVKILLLEFINQSAINLHDKYGSNSTVANLFW